MAVRTAASLGVVVGCLFVLGVGAWAQAGLSICDYTPPESRMTSLSLEGSFLWYDGPYADDRARSLSAKALAQYSLLVSTEQAGHGIDASAEVRATDRELDFSLDASSNVKSYVSGDTFAIGAADLATSNDAVELDLTAGVGTGRFRDVTPLATAVRIQNALLDLGILLAPLENDTLLSLAQILGTVGMTDEDRIVAVTAALVGTGLVKDGDLGVRGLLELEQSTGGASGGRLCGRDLQARVGVSVALVPAASLAATGVLEQNFALVPDPVSQITSNVTCKAMLTQLGRLTAAWSIGYVRQLPDGWTGRASYQLTYDRGWTAADETGVAHLLSASVTTQVFGGVGLTAVGELRYATGDEELTTSLTIHLTYDLF